MMTRQDAINLLHEWVKSESLRKHCLAVASAMEGYAIKNNMNKESWFICGLLHEFDWERFPNIELHPVEGCKKLRELKCDEEIIEAIMGHNSATGVQRKSLMAKTLFAVDELCGLIVALAKVRPNGFEGMNANSVKKAVKKKDFAAAINREDISDGIVELEVDEDEHFELVIDSLRKARL